MPNTNQSGEGYAILQQKPQLLLRDRSSFDKDGEKVFHRNMKAIHGGKAKNDRIDSFKIATMLRDGMLPQAYVYPRAMRSTRDLLRRRSHLVGMRGDFLAHAQMSHYQHALEKPTAKFAY